MTKRKATTRRKPKPKRSATTAAERSAAQLAKFTLGSRIRERIGPNDFAPRPAHLRVLRAFAEVMDTGGPVNWTLVARTAKISREALWKLRARYPGLEPWLMEQARARGERMAGAILERLGIMAWRPAWITP